MHIACSVPRATYIHTGCVIFTAFPLQQWLNQRASVLRCACTLPVVIEKGCDHHEVLVEAEVIVEQRAFETN